ncbi:MAG: smpB [Dehalococcoidia bacterium]|nr:smpB [Dehalococcoidia bacterium]
MVQNRKAHHDYLILERMEAGIALMGTEIKSIRAGKANLQDAYAVVQEGEVWLRNSHISRYEAGSRFNHDPDRPRKLLLHKDEIRKLGQMIREKGLTVVPLQLYLKNNYAKVELALAKGKRQYDKREAIAKRDADRDVQRAIATSARNSS